MDTLYFKGLYLPTLVFNPPPIPVKEKSQITKQRRTKPIKIHFQGAGRYVFDHQQMHPATMRIITIRIIDISGILVDLGKKWT